MLVHDQIVSGVFYHKVQERHLREIDLILLRAVEIYQAAKSTPLLIKMISADTTKSVDIVYTNTNANTKPQVYIMMEVNGISSSSRVTS